jgi:hypothetical protein
MEFIEFLSIPYESIKNSVNNKQRIIQIKPKIIIKGIRFIKPSNKEK